MLVNLAGFTRTWISHPATIVGLGVGVAVGWARANQWQSALSERTIGQGPHTSTHQSASGGPPEYALQPADLASHGSRDQRWENASARCGRNGNGERIPVGRRWSYANVTFFRHRRVSSAIHRTRPWSALPTLQLLVRWSRLPIGIGKINGQTSLGRFQAHC